jgi:MarR family transcriptional regulator for hemolysin
MRSRDNIQPLFDLLGELARRRYQAGEAGFATLGLGHSEARLLSLLRRQGGRAQQEALSASMNIDRSNAGRALLRLEREGLVRRQPDEADRRSRLVLLTDKGRLLAEQVDKLRRSIAREMLAALSNAEAGVVLGLLSKVVD